MGYGGARLSISLILVIFISCQVTAGKPDPSTNTDHRRCNSSNVPTDVRCDDLHDGVKDERFSCVCRCNGHSVSVTCIDYGDTLLWRYQGNDSKVCLKPGNETSNCTIGTDTKPEIPKASSMTMIATPQTKPASTSTFRYALIGTIAVLIAVVTALSAYLLTHKRAATGPAALGTPAPGPAGEHEDAQYEQVDPQFPDYEYITADHGAPDEAAGHGAPEYSEIAEFPNANQNSGRDEPEYSEIDETRSFNV